MSLPNPMFDAALGQIDAALDQTGEMPAVPAAGWPYEPTQENMTDPRPHEFELTSKAQAQPDAFVWPSEPKMPARLQTMMLPNGRWLLVLDNASEVERLDVDRERLCERTGAVDVLTFVGPVEVVEAYPEAMLERDEQLIGELQESLRAEADGRLEKGRQAALNELQIDALTAKLAEVRDVVDSDERYGSVRALGDVIREVLGETLAVPSQRVA